ncbi:unnamed protein product [Bubo scandiacus]
MPAQRKALCSGADSSCEESAICFEEGAEEEVCLPKTRGAAPPPPPPPGPPAAPLTRGTGNVALPSRAGARSPARLHREKNSRQRLGG